MLSSVDVHADNLSEIEDKTKHKDTGLHVFVKKKIALPGTIQQVLSLAADVHQDKGKC
jgi:hypothetical protein